MAIKQNNKTQSDIRFNLSNILGLSEEQAKMIAQNQDRLRGGISQTYFNGRNAGTESGGTDPTCTQCGGGSGGGGSGGGGSGGGGSGGGGSSGGGSSGGDCIGIALNTRPKDECVYGVDCKTGSPIGIYPKEPPVFECPKPPRPDDECFNGYVAVIYPYPTVQGQNDAQLSSLDDIQGAFDSVVQKGVENAKQQFIEEYGSGGTFKEIRLSDAERSISSCGVIYNYKEYRIYLVYQINGWDRTGSATASVVTTNSTQSSAYQNGLANWNKNKPKKYTIKNGKIVDLCDNALPVDCIEMCDKNGNKYKVCGDGSVTGID